MLRRRGNVIPRASITIVCIQKTQKLYAVLKCVKYLYMTQTIYTPMQ